MAGGGDTGAQSSPSSGITDNPGFVTGVLSPLMRVIGLGIAARGGALGPMLASGGDFIAQARDEALQREVYANIMPGLLAGVNRSRETVPARPGTPAVPGKPGTPDVEIPFLAGVKRPVIPMAPDDQGTWQPSFNATPPASDYVTASGEPAMPPGLQPYEVPLTLPGRAATPAIPEGPGTPAVVRSWQSEPTLPEAIARLQAMGGSQTSKSLAFRELMRSEIAGRLPQSDATVPPDVRADIQRGQNLEDKARLRGYALTDEERRRGYTIQDEQRHLQARIDEERRKAPIFQSAAPAGAQPGYGASAAAGLVPPAPAPQTRVEYTPDGRERLVDARTGEVLKDAPLRTPEQEAARTQAMTVLIPQLERDFEAAVSGGIYTKDEAGVGRAILANARRTGDPEGFLRFAQNVAAERGKERQAEIRAKRLGLGVQPTETVTTRDETIPTRPIWHKDELKALTDRVPDVVREAIPNFQPPKGPIKTPSGKTVTPAEYIAIAKRQIEQTFKDQHGVDVTVQWVPASGKNPLTGFGLAPWASSGEWKIIRAREPERKKSSVTERKKGPPNIVPVPVPTE